MVFKTIGFHEIFLRKRRWPKIGAKKLLEFRDLQKKEKTARWDGQKDSEITPGRPIQLSWTQVADKSQISTSSPPQSRLFEFAMVSQSCIHPKLNSFFFFLLQTYPLLCIPSLPEWVVISSTWLLKKKFWMFKSFFPLINIPSDTKYYWFYLLNCF